MKAESTVRFIGLFVFVFIFFITPLHAEEGTVKAMSAWQSQGKLFKVGEIVLAKLDHNYAHNPSPIIFRNA